MRDFNACVARAVSYHTPQYPGGRLWARRYSSEFLPAPEDIEEYFFYTVLQPIKDGLVEDLKDHPAYNCFHDAVRGKVRKFKVVDWTRFHATKRHNPKANIKDFTTVVSLKFERLPGYENLSQAEYAKVMNEKLQKRRLAILAERRKKGLRFAGPKALGNIKRGALPKKTKTSGRTSHRPRVLSVCNKRRAECRAWYFKIYFDFKLASKNFREGKLDAKFPKGTYRPWTKFHPPKKIAA